MPAVIMLVSAVVLAVEGWLTMLIIGALHSEVPEVPTFNYSGSLWVVILVHLLVGMSARAGTGRD